MFMVFFMLSIIGTLCNGTRGVNYDEKCKKKTIQTKYLQSNI
jgi:hypothetical protein